MTAPIQKLNSSGKKDSVQFSHSFVLSGILCLVFSAIVGCSSMHGPTATSPKAHECDEFSPLSGMIGFYQGPMKHISPVRFGECPMFPHCSQYALESIRTHGVILGWFMTCDRLMRCGRDEVHISPEIIVDGKWKTLDPVDSDDQWIGETRH